MASLKAAVLAAGMLSTVYAQVLDGDSVAVTTATAVATVQASDNGDDQPDATVFSILQDAGPATATAQNPATGSVVSIYFPGADPLPYVASLIGQSDGAQTLAVSCGPGVDSDTCGFPSSVTIIAGPSTAYVSVSNQEATFIYDCKITASTAAVCAETFNGDAGYIQSQTKAAGTGSTSSVLTETLGSTDITWMPVTITAAGGKAIGTAAPVAPTGGDGWIGVGSLGSSSATTVSVPTTIPSSATVPGSSPGWSGWNSGSASGSASASASGSAPSGGSSWAGWNSASVPGSGPSSGSGSASGSASTGTGTGSAPGSGASSWAGWNSASVPGSGSATVPGSGPGPGPSASAPAPPAPAPPAGTGSAPGPGSGSGSGSGALPTWSGANVAASTAAQGSSGGNGGSGGGAGGAGTGVSGTATAGTGVAGTSAGASGTNTSVSPARWTGAANRLSGFANYAAGLLAIAGLAL